MANTPSPDTATAPDAVIAADTVLRQTTWCVMREQRDEYLVYNPRTDELHLISPLGRYLCARVATTGRSRGASRAGNLSCGRWSSMARCTMT